MTTITLHRHVPVDPERAFAAWVDPEELALWWWPQWPDTHYAINARLGGEYRIYSAGLGMGITGTFTKFEHARSLAMTWIWIGADGPAQVDGVPVVDTVEVTFVPSAEGTDVTVAHRSTQDLSEGGAQQGWDDVLDRLPGHLAAPDLA